MPTIAPRRELFAWAMYDFANSGYTTVVLTTIFNAYFVGVVVGRAARFPEGVGTLLWTLAVSISLVREADRRSAARSPETGRPGRPADGGPPLVLVKYSPTAAAHWTPY